MSAPIPTERMIQRATIKMLRTVFPRVFTFAVPNGAHLAGNSTARFKQIGALKGDGMVVGTPDIVCLWTKGSALIEVKRPKTGRMSDDQKRVHELLGFMGIPVKTVTHPDQAYAFLRECGCPWSGIDPREDKSDPLWGAHG